MCPGDPRASHRWRRAEEAEDTRGTLGAACGPLLDGTGGARGLLGLCTERGADSSVSALGGGREREAAGGAGGLLVMCAVLAVGMPTATPAVPTGSHLQRSQNVMPVLGRSAPQNVRFPPHFNGPCAVCALAG